MKYFIMVLFLTNVMASEIGIKLINGKVVEKGNYPQVVLIRSSSGSACTATVIGPRVVLTAAHCARTNQSISYSVKGVKYRAKVYRSSLYPGRDHDVAVGITQEAMAVLPATVGGQAYKGLELTIFGYGCTKPGGGGMDGKLRMGVAEVTGFSGYDMVSKKGAALCFGDSGGPSFVKVESGQYQVLGVNSKGNIKTTNYNTRLDTKASKEFFDKITKTHKVKICGVNLKC